MASGDTLLIFTPFNNEPTSSSYATFGTTNLHPLLLFSTSTQSRQQAVFTAIMPQNYSNATGVTVYTEATMGSATSGTIGWTVSFERMDVNTQLSADSFGAETVITAATVPASLSFPLLQNTAVTKGTNMDNVVAGDTFRLKLTRNASVDTASSNAQLLSVEVRET